MTQDGYNLKTVIRPNVAMNTEKFDHLYIAECKMVQT